jgi:cytochrome P450
VFGESSKFIYADTLNKVDDRREHNNVGSFMDKVLDQNEELGLNRHELYFLGGVCMEGGSDTSSSIIIAFVQAMTKFPEVLKKAQKEMDSVVGEDRSPVWSDYVKLPYIATCVKEAQRWRPVVPTTFPRALTEGTALRV